MLQRKLLNQLKITNNKIYEDLPRGRLRRTAKGSESSENGVVPDARTRRSKVKLRTSARLEEIREEKPVERLKEGPKVERLRAERPKERGRPRAEKKIERPVREVTQRAEPVARSSKRRRRNLSPEPAPKTLIVKLRYNARRQKLRALLGVSLITESPDGPETEKAERARVPRQSSERARRSLEMSSQVVDIVNSEPEALPSDLETRSTEVPLPYNGVLGFPDCTINKTDPTALDRQVFEKFQKKGDLVRAELQNDMLSLMNGTMSDLDANTPIPQSASNYYKRSQIEKIQFRDYLINTWYSSPFPEEYSKNKVIYMCEYCLKYMSLPTSYTRHGLKSCNLSQSHPPGIEIYRDDAAKIAFWEVDGRKNIEYCQNLCLLAKLFLNSKTLYYDVEPFVFYILTEIDEHDPSVYHFVGYFSKEKLNNSDYNVSCIITLPIYQRKGYGSLMIDFSYLLSRKEFKFGTPEKPLSDLGLVSYRNYWKLAVAFTLRSIYRDYMKEGNRSVSLLVETLSKLTGMRSADVVFGLEQVNGLVKRGSDYSIVIDLPVVESVIENWENKGYVTIKPELCLWKPLIYGPSGGINSAPLAPAVAPAMGDANENVPQNNSAPAVTNSISMITEFLKDDIDNPFTYEEEAGKEIEHYTEAKPTRMVDKADPRVRLCHADFEMPSRYAHQDEDDLKVMVSDDDNSDADPEFEEFKEETRKRRKFQVVDSDDEDMNEDDESEDDENEDDENEDDENEDDENEDDENEDDENGDPEKEELIELETDENLNEE